MRAGRHHHELLEVDARIGMSPAVQNVHHRHRQREPIRSVQRSDVAIQRCVRRRCTRTQEGHRNAKQRIRPEPAFGGRAVEADECRVERLLIVGVALELPGDFAVDVGDRFSNAFAAVPGLVAVPQFERFALTGGRAGGNRGATKGTVLEHNVDFDSRIAAGIQNFSTMHACDFHRLRALDVGKERLGPRSTPSSQRS
jgi:hypothetical protein